MTTDTAADWAVGLLVALESLELIIITIWIILWSRIIIPRRRIVATLDRLEAALDDKDKALELSHRENEAILVNAVDLSKKLRHCMQRSHEHEAMINELRERLGLKRLSFGGVHQIDSLRKDLKQYGGENYGL